MQAPTRATLAATFADPQAFGVVQLIALIAQYGTEPLASDEQSEGWSPANILAELERDLQVKPTMSCFGRLMAAVTLLQDPARFYTNLPDFIDLANALNGDSYDPGVVDFVSAMEAAWAFYEAYLIERLCLDPSDDPEDQTPEASPEVRAYLGQVLDREGIVNPPDILRLGDHDPDRMGRILGDFSGDVEMFEAISQVESDKADEITNELLARLRLLVSQLARLFRTDAPDVVRAFGIRLDADGLLD